MLAVLAVLALRAGEVVSADRLTDVVWGDRPPADTVQTHMSGRCGGCWEGPARSKREAPAKCSTWRRIWHRPSASSTRPNKRGTRFVALEGQSHFPHVGDARAVVDAVVDFLAEPLPAP